MFLYKTIPGLVRYLEEIRAAGDTIGFVPTMGALHEGHGSMIRHSVSEGHHTLVSIFVNPTQFDNQEDLHKYPRNITRDLEFLHDLGCHVLFLPDEKEIYPETESVSSKMDLGALGTTLEGAFRPGHFDGVVQVMERLLWITEPDFLFMGEKDLQQLTIIRKLIKKMGINTALKGMPVVREESGLALSSRNERLSAEQKKKAVAIFKALEDARKNFDSSSEEDLRNQAVFGMESEGLKVEYFEFVNGDTMESIDSNGFNSGGVFAVVAAWCDQVRLIDNMRMS